MPYSSVHNSESLFVFLAVSQNLNNDLWSKLQGYAANKVVRVMFKGLFFFKWEKKNQFYETDTSLWKMKVSTLKKKRNWKRKLLSCVWLYDPMDCSPSGFSVHGILQARILEWVAIPFSRGSSWSRDRTWVSHIVGRFFTIWATGKSPLKKKILSQRVIFYTYESSPQAHSTACSSLQPLPCGVPQILVWTEVPVIKAWNAGQQ